MPIQRVVRFAVVLLLLLLLVGGAVLFYPDVRDRLTAPGEALSGLRQAAGSAKRADETATATPEGQSLRPPTSGSETWYQWTDERGSVRFAQSLDEVPPRWRDKVGRVEMTPIQRTPTQHARVTKKRKRAIPSAVQPNPHANSDEVIIYTTAWCGVCRRATRYFDDRGVDYIEKDIEDDPDAEEEFLAKSGGSRGVPLIDVYGTIVRGFSAPHLDKILQDHI